MPRSTRAGRSSGGHEVHTRPRPALVVTRRTTSYTGEPVGLVFEFEDGTRVYFAGDTNAFGDMQLIARLYKPEVAVLPIGDHYTMGPKEAAVALELLGVKRCIPCHCGTSRRSRARPSSSRELTDVEVSRRSRARRSSSAPVAA